MPSSQAIHEPAPYKLTVDAYHALAKAGHLREDARVELIDGVILEMAPIGWPHGRIGGRVTRELVRAVGDRGFVVPNDSGSPASTRPTSTKSPVTSHANCWTAADLADSR